MYKLAAVTAVAAAASIDEFKETAEMFKITVHQQEAMKLEHHARALEMESKKYEMQMQNSAHGKQFEKEVVALVHSKEFVELVKFVEALKKRGPTEQIKKVKAAYLAQMHKVQAAHMKLKMMSKKTSTMTGTEPNQTLHINIDNDQWVVFNKEYYKLRAMEYMIQHKLPEMVAIRKHVHEVIDNDEFEAIEDHWKQVTQQQQHQVVVHHQWKLFEAAIGVLHMEEADKKWMDPANSPVMFDAWHMVHVYFMAVAKGDLEPMLDWMVDGEYDDDFVKQVNPHFEVPTLYLF